MTMPSFRAVILISISVIAIAVLLFAGPIPQDPSYHLFADSREFVGVVNAWNVLSNIPFLLVGIYGLWRCKYLSSQEARTPYAALCVGVLLVGFGSAYYHLSPSTPSLLWDRLPMTITFMALFSLVLDERVLPSRKIRTLWPLLTIGIGAVLYWYWTESNGHGDLRAYILVQFLPMLLLPTILLLFPGQYLKGRALAAAMAFYLVAKLFEQFDGPVFQALGILSGHSLKHLVSAIAVFCIVIAVPVRQRGAGVRAVTSRTH